MKPEYLKIDWLKANHQMIHYFGLGFIQLKLNQQERFHFYSPLLPPIVGQEDVHNHRYDFSSYVVSGTFHQEMFQVVDGDSHVLEKESCKAGVEVSEPGVPCGLSLSSSHHYGQGSSYWTDHKTFHRVTATSCITLVKRSDYKKELAEVVRPLGADKVCPFSKGIPEEELWAIVEQMLVYHDNL